jgi:hypothetical protein
MEPIAFPPGTTWTRWFEKLTHLTRGNAEAFAFEDVGKWPEFLDGWLETAASVEDAAIDEGEDFEYDYDDDDRWRQHAESLWRQARVVLQPPQELLVEAQILENPHWIFSYGRSIWTAWSFSGELALVTYDDRDTFGYPKLETGNWYPVGFARRESLRESLDLLIEHGLDLYYPSVTYCAVCGLPWCGVDNESYELYRDTFDDEPVGTVFMTCCEESTRVRYCEYCDRHLLVTVPGTKRRNFAPARGKEPRICRACAQQEQAEASTASERRRYS